MEVNSTIEQEQDMVKYNSQSGFTLMELMIAMSISGVLLAGMVTAFTGQSRGYNTQQEITELQEEIRASLDMLTSEIRLAGFDPDGTADAKIEKANATELIFTADINGDGDYDKPPGTDPNEIIRYAISGTSLGRATGAAALGGAGILQPLVENIENLAFEYLIDVDADTWVPLPADLKKIRAVKIIVMGRTDRQTSAATDSSSFRPPIAAAPDWTPGTPGKYQRRMMSVVVQCRNLQG